MKKNSFYIILIVFFIILIIGGMYNFFHPINSNTERQIESAKVLGVFTEKEYNNESKYVDKYYLKEKSKDEIIIIDLDKDLSSKYKKNDKINYYEEKGELLITDEKPQKKNNLIWLIISISEMIVVIFLIKRIKNN